MDKKTTDTATTKTSKVARIIAGKDLRKMRIFSGLNTTDLAEIVGVKSRKTIENWEKDYCEPTINQFVLFASGTGFNAGFIVAEILRRNREDPTQTWDINLEVCQL